MREPFHMPSGCPVMTVDVDILGALPFCSVPSLADPVFAPKLPAVVVPDIAPPDTCLCLSLDVDMSMHVIPSRHCSVHANFGKISRNADCCDGAYNLSLAIDVPCLPLSVYASGDIKLSGIADPTMHLALTRRAGAEDQCALGIQLSIDIPCIGFDMVGSAYVAFGAPSAPQANLHVSRKANDCDIGLRLSILLPDFDIDPMDIPCFVGDADATGTKYKSIKVYGT